MKRLDIFLSLLLLGVLVGCREAGKQVTRALREYEGTLR